MKSAGDVELLWSRLEEAGLVEGAPPPSGPTAAPWFVRAMLGAAGWLGALFLLLFTGMALRFVVESAPASLITGVAACAAAGALLRVKPENDFAVQFALALSLAGQGLALCAFVRWLSPHERLVAPAMALFQAILFLLIPNAIHRVWTSWTGGCAVVFALASWRLQPFGPGLLSAACAWVWLEEFRSPKYGGMVRSGGYGLVLALVGAVAATAWAGGDWLWGPEAAPPSGSGWRPWLGAGASGAALLWAVGRLLARESTRTAAPDAQSAITKADPPLHDADGLPPNAPDADRRPSASDGLVQGDPLRNPGIDLFIAGVAAILALATLKAPGLAPAVLILLLGFGNANPTLLGLGAAALLGYLSFYYYSLEATLLYKSALMSATGIILLAARLIRERLGPASGGEEAPHA
jgi:hypothetical protein